MLHFRIARRGSASWKLEVTGKPAHSSQVFTDRVGTGAIYETSRILNEFYSQLSVEENLTFNPGFILGGTSVELKEDGTGGSALCPQDDNDPNGIPGFSVSITLLSISFALLLLYRKVSKNKKVEFV